MKSRSNPLKSLKFWRKHHLILRELKFFPKIIILALVFTLLSAAFQGVGIGFVLTFLQSLTEPDAAPVRSGIDWIDTYILGIGLPELERVYRVSTALFISTILQAIFTGLSTFYSGIAQSQLVLQIQLRIFQHLKSLDLSYFTQTKSGDLVNGITTEASELKNVFDTISFIIIRSSILAVYLVSMLWISWQLTIIIAFLFPLISLCMARLFAMIRAASFEMTKARSKYTSRAIEFINGIRTVQVSAAQDFEYEKIRESALDVFKAEISSCSTRAIVEPVPETVVMTLVIVIMLFCFQFLMPSGNFQVASLLTLLFIIIRTLPIVRQLNNAKGKVNKYQGSVEATEALLESHGKSFFKNGYREFKGLQREIKFESVDFSYVTDRPVIQGINLEIQRGQMVAFVGSSGAGKSTLADLLPRFYDPTCGRILIDGIDLREIEIASFRRKMSVVSQDTFIFNSTVRANIAYSLDDVGDEAILDAARMANAFDFIQELPEGLDTQLGDRGVLLSGGQRQRIAIARALLRDPEILILDEATSALDSVTERLIQESIEKLAVGRTVIAIAHRLSTIARADQVVVLEKGQILEQGTYQELLDKKERFWQYHQMQK